MGQRQRLGEILQRRGLVTAQQLAQAAEEQRRSGCRLGEALVRLGFVGETDLARALAEQAGIAFVGDSQLQVDEGVARRLPEVVARQYEVLPVAESDEAITVALVDPLNIFFLDELSYALGKRIQPVVVTRGALHRAIRRVYSGGDGAGEPATRGEEAPGAESPAVSVVDDLIRGAVEEGASDIHVEPLADGIRVRYRVDGLLRNVMSLPADLHGPVINRIKLLGELDIAERRVPQDGRLRLRHKGRDVDLRVSTLPTVYGEKAVIRLLDQGRAITRLEDLGFSPETLQRYRKAIAGTAGIILVTGPTGSGKTSTLIATLHELNGPEKNIVTVEDPVEYHVPGVNQVQVNVRAGLTFASGLRSILRQDPDVIMIGEIRDGETAETAIRAALTGHLVLSTLHTNDAAGAVTRLTDMGVEPYLVASAVIGSLAQRLARRVCDHCAEEYELPPDAPERVLFRLGPEAVRFRRGRGCGYCNGTGYRGRIALAEFFALTPALREAVAAGEPAASLRRQAVAEGMITLAEDGVRKACLGLTTLEEVRRVAFWEV